MKKLTRSQIKGIRLVADFLVMGDITDKVMAKMLTPRQLNDFKNHLKQNCPQAFVAGEELQRQIKEVRTLWKAELTNREQAT